MFGFSECQRILKNEPDYRLKQAKKAVFQDLIGDWQKATNLPKALREQLTSNCSLEIKAKLWKAKDSQSDKSLITLNDGLRVETVLMRHKGGRNTVCVSSQVGCPLACKFCATGKLGFKRNLTFSEIISQVLFFARFLKKQNQKIVNIVFMGMGEPFLNIDNVFKAIKLLNDKDGFNLGARHFSISTVGITEGIKRLANEFPQVNLALSLHAADNKLRSQLMPINKKYPLSQVVKTIDAYIKKTNRRVMLEYIMIAGINDSCQDAKKLAVLAKRLLCFVNLITYNPTGDFQPSPTKKINEFKQILEKHQVPYTQRYRFGQEIKAACGQLAEQGRSRAFLSFRPI